MKKENEKMGFSFVLPDRLNVREQLQYKGRLGVNFGGEETYPTLWHAAAPLITEWQCALIPDHAALDLENVYDPAIADIVSEVGMLVYLHTRTFEAVPKN